MQCNYNFDNIYNLSLQFFIISFVQEQRRSLTSAARVCEESAAPACAFARRHCKCRLYSTLNRCSSSALETPEAFLLMSPSRLQSVEPLPCIFTARPGTPGELVTGDGLAVRLSELSAGLLGDGFLSDGLLNGEDSKPLNSDFFFTGAVVGDDEATTEIRDKNGVTLSVNRSERLPTASRENRADELMMLLGDGRALEAMPAPLPSCDPAGDALSVFEESACRCSAPSTDARRGVSLNANSRTAAKTAAGSFLFEPQSRLLVSALPWNPQSAAFADAGHRTALDLLFSGVIAATAAGGTGLALLVSNE